MEAKDYGEFKKTVLDMFSGLFMDGEPEAEHCPFTETEQADAVIRRHFAIGRGRKEMEAADTELESLFSRYCDNGERF